MPEKGSNLFTYYPQGDVYPHRDERIDLMVDEEGRLVDRTTKRVLTDKELKEMNFLLEKGNAVMYSKDKDGYNVPFRGRIAGLFEKPKRRHRDH